MCQCLLAGDLAAIRADLVTLSGYYVGADLLALYDCVYQAAGGRVTPVARLAVSEPRADAVSTTRIGCNAAVPPMKFGYPERQCSALRSCAH